MHTFTEIAASLAMLLLALMAAVLVVAFSALVYREFAREGFTLDPSAWHCTASHQETRSGTIIVGKALLPDSSVVTVCDRYERRN